MNNANPVAYMPNMNNPVGSVLGPTMGGSNNPSPYSYGGGQPYGGGGNNGFIGNLLGSPQSPAGFGVNPMLQSGAFGGAYGDISALEGYGGYGNAVLGPAQQTMSNLYNNPFAQQSIFGAQQGANMGQNIAGTAFGAGNQMLQGGLDTIPYAYQVMNMGFDPQGALYGRTAQQVQDQVRAGEAARGIQTTPYGAGVEGQAMSNFNIDWQNNQLARAAQAAGAGGNLLGQGTNMANTGLANMYGLPSFLTQSSMLPYATWSGIGSDQNQALQAYLQSIGGAQGISNLPIQDWMGYMGATTNQQNANTKLYEAQLQGQKNQLGFLGDIGKGIGSVLGAIF